MRTAKARSGPPTSDDAVVVGLDGGYVRDRHRRPARTFEVVAGQIRTGGTKVTRFAFVRAGRWAGAEAMTQALRDHGVRSDARVTVLTDGDPGLRAIQRAALPDAHPVLDWFHIAMRWQHLHQLATGAGRHGLSAEARTWLLNRIGRGKWALWNGQLPKTRRHLSDLLDWTWTAQADLSWLARVNKHVGELLSYLNANADSLPNYGARYCAGQPISTTFAGSPVNAIVARRDQEAANDVEPTHRSTVPGGSRRRPERHA